MFFHDFLFLLSNVLKEGRSRGDQVVQEYFKFQTNKVSDCIYFNIFLLLLILQVLKIAKPITLENNKDKEERSTRYKFEPNVGSRF